MSDIPEWAKDRALNIANAEAGFEAWRSVENSFGMRAFARYIAEHEEPPVDPLVAEAQTVADHYLLNLSAMPTVEKALQAALKRGMELAREQS